MISALLGTVSLADSITPQISNNAGAQDYSRWSRVVNSYLYQSDSSTMTRVEYIDGDVCIENYDASGSIRSQKKIHAELPLFGGFYCGQQYNFLVFGQKNDAEQNSAEVIRLVKYSKSWSRIASVSVYGNNTVEPFNAGSLRMEESGNILIIRTSHQMYTHTDGIKHQANLTVSVNTSTMQMLDIQSRIWNLSTGYVSHSFNQFLLKNGNDLITLDHGDARPRSIVLCKYPGAMSSGTFAQVSTAEPLVITGEQGNNFTGTSVGGMELSSTSILIAGNSVNHFTSSPWLSGNRNAFICVVDRNNITSSSFKWLTGYSEDGKNEVSTPQITKVNNDLFIMMWTESDDTTKVRKLDGRGNVLESAQFDGKLLSDCKPQMINGKVTWYQTDGGKPAFYAIDPNNIGSLKAFGSKPLTGLRFPASSGTMNMGETKKLELKLQPEDATLKEEVTWTSSTSYVATVDSHGNVTAKYPGKTTIEASADGKTATYELTVKAPIQSISLSETSLNLTEGNNQRLYVRYDPVITTDSKTVSWKSSDEKVATVSSDGTVTGIGKGTATITATVGTKKASCTVTVTARDKTVQVTSVSLSASSMTLTEGEQERLEATVYPSNATDKTVTWSCSDGSVLQVSNNGLITAKKAGTATVTAKAGDKMSTCQVTVMGKKDDSGNTDHDQDPDSGETEPPKKTAHTVNTISFQHGTLSADPQTADEGERVTLTGKMQDGFVITGLEVTSMSRQNLSVMKEKENVYSFQMPDEDVYVSRISVEWHSHISQCPSSRFVDVNKNESHWTHQPIDYVLEKGYMAGLSATRFAPEGTVTRAQIVQILYAREGKPEISGRKNFNDVAKGQWYTNAIEWASSHSIVAGYTDGTFKPNQAITREQMVTILRAYAGYKGMNTAATGNVSSFPDSGRISNYAMQAMKWAVGNRLIGGTGKGIEPKGTATRAQIAVILKAYDQNIK